MYAETIQEVKSEETSDYKKCSVYTATEWFPGTISYPKSTPRSTN